MNEQSSLNMLGRFMSSICSHKKQILTRVLQRVIVAMPYARILFGGYLVAMPYVSIVGYNGCVVCLHPTAGYIGRAIPSHLI